MKSISYRPIAFWVIPFALTMGGTLHELRAAGLAISQVAGSPAGYVTNDLAVSTGAGESISNMDMWLRLNAGTIFQHPNGGDTRPEPAIVLLDPTVGFDSFVNGVIIGASQGLGSPNSGGPRVVNTSTFDVRWVPEVGQNTENRSNFVARLTLSSSAIGLMSFAVDPSQSFADFRGEYAVRNGVITLVPEPASISLIALALASLLCFAQRRASRPLAQF